MLKPIPVKILAHTATLKVCEGIDVWQQPTYADIPLTHVCVQPTHAVRLTKDNTQVELSSVLFIDARVTNPAGYDVEAAQTSSLQAGAPLQVVFNNRTYEVLTIDTLYDDEGNYHHAEVGLK